MFPEGKQILLIEEAGEARPFRSLLRSMGQQVTVVPDPAAALETAAREEFDMALVGIGMAGGGPAGLLGRLRALARIPSILILADQSEADRAVRTLALGADDYLLKPADRLEVRTRVGRILRWQDLDDRVLRLQKELSRKYLLGNLVTRSQGMRRVRAQILQVAAARSTVLIQGESGVGKELVAKAIHYNSPRRDAPFIAINCSAIPITLIESELFGHERGAFTGAFERQKGKFELAHGGTIFLDEIGDMDLRTQAKLLRVLEEREFMRVGGAREVRVDVRVLAATNSDLEALIDRRQFRQDLYFRLKVISIRVPPLRERVGDIPDLSRLFLDRICRENGLPPRRLTRKAIAALQRYSWPGNVRELKNVLESTAITGRGEWIRSADLPSPVRDGGAARSPGYRPRVGATLAEMQRDLIRRTLVHTRGNRTHAARALHIGVRTLQRRIKDYGIEVPYRPTRTRTGRTPQRRDTETPSPGASEAGST
ncbi:MAG: sigma 54-interacting transcriptional regulator [Acidobacteriota bacterium]